MYRIVFTSRASRHFRQEDIASLRKHAASANEREGLTGLFLFDGSRFLLALEGPEIPLLKVMNKIYADDRHHDIVFILSEPAREREFPSWAMSQVLTDQGKNGVDFLETVKREVARVSNVSVKAHFIGFASLARATRTWV